MLIVLSVVIFLNKLGSGFSGLTLNVIRSLTPKRGTDVLLIFYVEILRPLVNPFLSVGINGLASAPCEKERLGYSIIGADYSGACLAAEINALYGHLVTTLFMEVICKV